MFYHMRLIALHGITKVVNNICVSSFEDIIQKMLVTVQCGTRHIDEAINFGGRMAQGGRVKNLGEGSSSTRAYDMSRNSAITME